MPTSPSYDFAVLNPCLSVRSSLRLFGFYLYFCTTSEMLPSAGWEKKERGPNHQTNDQTNRTRCVDCFIPEEQENSLKTNPAADTRDNFISKYHILICDKYYQLLSICDEHYQFVISIINFNQFVISIINL